MTHTGVSILTIIGSDNGLSPGRHQAIIWTNDGILLIGPVGTNFSENRSKIHTFSFKKMHLKTSSAKWRPFCLGLDVLRNLEGMDNKHGHTTITDNKVQNMCLDTEIYFGHQKMAYISYTNNLSMIRKVVPLQTSYISCLEILILGCSRIAGTGIHIPGNAIHFQIAPILLIYFRSTNRRGGFDRSQ